MDSTLLMQEVDAADHSIHAAGPPIECPTRANLRLEKSTSTPVPSPVKNAWIPRAWCSHETAYIPKGVKLMLMAVKNCEPYMYRIPTEGSLV